MTSGYHARTFSHNFKYENQMRHMKTLYEFFQLVTYYYYYYYFTYCTVPPPPYKEGLQHNMNLRSH